ncbi:hypothetical protein GN956_G24602 [Arapaima gigas]
MSRDSCVSTLNRDEGCAVSLLLIGQCADTQGRPQATIGQRPFSPAREGPRPLVAKVNVQLPLLLHGKEAGGDRRRTDGGLECSRRRQQAS